MHRHSAAIEQLHQTNKELQMSQELNMIPGRVSKRWKSQPTRIQKVGNPPPKPKPWSWDSLPKGFTSAMERARKDPAYEQALLDEINARRVAGL
jgi:hypothetical protein